MTTALARPRAPLAPWAGLTSGDPLDVVPRLLALLVVPTTGGWPTIVGVMVAAVVAATPALFRSPALWISVGVSRLAVDFTDWHGVDDHEVLISYACVAFGLALWTSDPARTARASLPALVGLTMALATGWKLASGQFVDGDTMRYTMLTDPRFDLATSWFGGMSDAALQANDVAVAELRGPSGSEAVALVEPLRVTLFAHALTVGALVIEGWMAVAFLWARVSARFRARLLAVFCLGTYVIVPVSRFGIILAACAYAGSERRHDRAVLLSAVAFCVVWPVVWTGLGGTQ